MSSMIPWEEFDQLMREQVRRFPYATCPCNTWARGYESFVLTSHHRNCDQYRAEDEVQELETAMARLLAKLTQYEQLLITKENQP